MRRSFLIIISLFIFSLSALSAADYRFSSRKMDSGLSNNSVFCLTQDSLGYMWIGTFGGLNRYDGNEYIIYKPNPTDSHSITSSVIFDIFEDSAGRIWVGTDGGGLNLYNRETDSFTSYRFDPNDPTSISSDQVYSVMEDSAGILWIGTGGGGLNRMTNDGEFFSYTVDKKNRNSLHSTIIRKIIQDSSGVIWIGTDGGGLARYQADEDYFSSYTYHRRLSDGRELTGLSIKSLFEDSRNQIWVGYEDTGLARFNPERLEFIPVTLTGDPDEMLSVRSINEDSKGRIWVGTDGEGLFIISAPGDNEENVITVQHDDYTPSSLNNNRVRDIYIDQTDLIWIGMRDGGINLFNPLSLSFNRNTKSSAPPNNLQDNQIREIVESDDHMIWAATDSGILHRIDGSTGEVTIPDIDFNGASNSTFSLLAEKNLFWIGTDGNGLYAMNRENGTIVHHYQVDDGSRLQSNVIWDIYRDTSGTLWVGTENGGLHALNEEEETFNSYRFETDNPHSILGNSVRDIYEDSQGSLWIGTWDGGLNRFISETEGFERFSFIPGNLTSLSDNSVNVIFEDSEGTLWVGTTGGGLNRFNPDTRSFIAFGPKQGMPSDNILGILEDENGFFWISTNNGLARFHKKSREIVSFWEEDGLAGNEFSHKAYLHASDGKLYFGGSEGISYFYPEDIAPRSIDSPFLITGLSLHNEKITAASSEDRAKEVESSLYLDKPLNENPVIELEPTDRFITFTFALFDFVNPEKNLYAIKLDGLDSKWTDLGEKNSITFATIPPGTYSLLIKAVHYNGLPHETEQKITIHVDHYFYQKWSFIIPLTLLIGLMIYIVTRLRIRALEHKNAQLRKYAIHIQEAREKKGKAIAREIHDQLGQILTLLKFDLFRIKKQLGEEDTAEELLETTDSAIATVDSAVESVRTISTRLRPSALDSLSFSEAIQWQFSEFNRRTGIKTILDIREESHRIREEKAVTMYRIIQEILTNIIRHAEATKVQCIFHENDHEFYLQISDNGKGCTQKQINAKTAFGIISIRERCESLGGSVRISSRTLRKPLFTGTRITGEQTRTKPSLASGTRIEILIPIDKEITE